MKLLLLVSGLQPKQIIETHAYLIGIEAGNGDSPSNCITQLKWTLLVCLHKQYLTIGAGTQPVEKIKSLPDRDYHPCTAVCTTRRNLCLGECGLGLTTPELV